MYLQFFCHVIGDNSGKRGEQGSEEDTDITNFNCDMKEMHNVIENSRGDHET